MSTIILLMAAGASSRMEGRDKLLEPVDGTSLLRNRAEMCLNAEADAVHVVLSNRVPARKDALKDLDVTLVTAEHAHRGLSHSLRAGLEGIDTDGVLIVLADLVDLTTSNLNAVLRAAKAHPLAHVFRGADRTGKPGHPVLIRAALFDALRNISGDQGAQPVLKQHRSDTVLVPIGPAALRDLDTPQDWETWRNAK